MRKLLLVLMFLVPAAASASEAGYRLDSSQHHLADMVSLQNGARTFVNYCLNCHGAQYMRYNRLQDIGLTESQIRDNLLFSADKVGETMKVSLSMKDGKAWFGVPPPDLSVIARSRGADWLYTYLRTFYRDPKTTTGWNNAVFPSVAMPHALWTLQGERGLEIVKAKDKSGHKTVEYKWTQIAPGRMSAVEYERTVTDLVNFLVYVGEPSAQNRKMIGVWVLLVLAFVYVFAFALKKAYWKDVH